MLEPLSVSRTFPTTEEITRDAYSLKIISPAYASAQGELGTVLQYIYHSFFFEKRGYADIAETIKRIAVCEMIHLETLGKLILNLGAAPVFTAYPPDLFNFYSTKFISYSRTLKNMLEDDILGERRAIAVYEKMLLRLKNKSVAEIIERLLADEKLHLSTLTEIAASSCLNG